ncbi:peptide ABC transporter substrate-binding protein [Iamia sp. SCSIO 61187]|uniref:ABC transporter substrate-binding protein n=1 Tax=Iamia sp. SCSIO 61187 TaxID=2722752 RepID=UPI001C6344F4|nr:ABC transporter substrate-binding protein [Iamia sp. SCSIO 61187]QYG93263.1 peptide ABC transporter substrate-binding protein [Iamia sp. SCSIO 61187]
MVRSRRLLSFLALILGFALLAASCGGSDDEGGDDTAGGDGGGDETETTVNPDDIPEGGNLVLGAEQEPDCVDWISSCAGASWGFWTMNVNTMPRTFDVVQDGDEWVYEPSILLDGEPELEEEPQQVVTYTISEDAVWSDGEPITSTDFKYTWDQIANGEDIYDTTGYANIESVDDSDPKVAVVTFSEPFSDWKGLFGGGYGIYPSHILEGEDRNAMMANGYDFSGGPWMIEEWAKGSEVVLVPNENYWGPQPKLESVTFRFVTDTAAEFQAYQAGEVSAIYPQPQLDVIESINAGVEGNSSFSDQTGNMEALWMNNSEFPFDSVAVRQAFAYSLDRDAIVEALFGGIGLTEALNTLEAPILSAFTDTEAFADYTLDLEQVDSLMTGDGWEKNADGFWEKDGQQADIEFITTSGNARRERTQEIVIEQAGEAGFNVTVANQEAGTFFGETLPNGDYQMGLYAQVATSLRPAACTLFCSDNIPSEENDFSGQNWQRVNIPEADPLMASLDTSTDPDEIQQNGAEAAALLAENVVSLPLDPLPNILLWSDDILGNVADNPILGPFSNMHEWGLAA